MTVIINTKLGESRGVPRVWLEGDKLAQGGISIGQNLDANFDKATKTITCFPLVEVEDQSDQGCVTENTFVVSRRTRKGKETPLIELRTKELAEIFDGIEMLRVSIKEGRICIRAHGNLGKTKKRIDRFKQKLATGETLSVGSLFMGGGVLDRAIHTGLESSGIKSKVKFAIEVEGKYLDSSYVNNPMLWDKDSILIESPIEKVEMRNPPEVDLICAGIPCLGASVSGRSKLKLKHCEEHHTAGSLFFWFLQVVQQTSPVCVVLENVPPYKNSASYAAIVSVLKSLDFEVQDTTLNGLEYGVLENRNRLAMVAVRKGLDFDLDKIVPHLTKPTSLSEVLEDIPSDSPRWKSYDYLAKKEKRDIANGKGFKRQLLTGDEPHLGVLGRSYYKVRSTEPQIKAPHDDNLSRLLTPKEHARVKGIPLEVINGINSETIAHEILGQSIIFPAFEALGKTLGSQLLKQSLPKNVPVELLECA